MEASPPLVSSPPELFPSAVRLKIPIPETVLSTYTLVCAGRGGGLTPTPMFSFHLSYFCAPCCCGTPGTRNPSPLAGDSQLGDAWYLNNGWESPGQGTPISVRVYPAHGECPQEVYDPLVQLVNSSIA